MRSLSEPTFTQTVLTSKSTTAPTRSTSSTVQGWDSHNYLTMALDESGCLHLAGNMHANPLTYFRARKPYDISSLVQEDAMLGRNEEHCTYPKFMTAPKGELLFHYRDGGSGNGNEIYNAYDVKTQRWRRFLDAPLTDGEGKRNAYMTDPTLGPDGWYHLLWVWRESSDASTCNHLSYARSRDLVNWENAAGAPLTLPITLKSQGIVIDPIPIKGGIINGCQKIGFDSQKRFIATYYKYDKEGNTQAYAARFENDHWLIRQISSWEGRHLFAGGGSGPSTFGTSVSLESVAPQGPGTLALPYSHWKHGRGVLLFKETTLETAGTESATAKASGFPVSLAKPVSSFAGMRVNWREDIGAAPDTSSRYVLRWETLGPNRDKPREGALPENGDLVLYRIKTAHPGQ
jgi:hypothetical protein